MRRDPRPFAFKADGKEPTQSRRADRRETDLLTPRGSLCLVSIHVGLARRQSTFLRAIPHLHLSGLSETVLQVQVPPQLQK